MKVALTAKRATGAIAVFFVSKIASGLLLLKLSAAWLTVADFSIFSQFLLLGALMTLISAAGVQQGVVRQVAAGDAGDLHRALAAARLLWFSVLAIVAPAVVLLSRQISVGLTGHADFAWAVPLIAGAALFAGPGQVACAALSGLGRTRSSLAAQASGMFCGTIAAVVMLGRGDAVGAAIAFYLGSMVTAPVAVLWLRRLGIAANRVGFSTAFAEARVLVRYSGGFLAVAGFTAITMFGLRYVYLLRFDATWLGYWLVAQRLSDTSTQLLGLFMMQYVVPAYTACDEASRDAMLRRCWLIASGAMVAVIAVFAAAPSLWVKLILSHAYAPAIGMILIYMSGDIARATVSLAMHTSLARARIVTYASLDILAACLMAVGTILFATAGWHVAPALGYLAGYGGIGTAILAHYSLRRCVSAKS